MEEAQSPSPISASQPTQPIQPTSLSDKNPKKSSKKILYVLLLIIVLIGIAAFAAMNLSKNSNSSQEMHPTLQKVAVQEKITLPSDVVKIQSCAAHKGTLYVKPQNIPVGPVFMVNKGEVIGIEYMLSKANFLDGKSFNFLEGLGMKVNHVNIGLLSAGHEGYQAAHYHVDLYIVDKNVEQGIKCPASNSTSAYPSPSAASPSAIIEPTINTPTSSPSANQ